MQLSNFYAESNLCCTVTLMMYLVTSDNYPTELHIEWNINRLSQGDNDVIR